MQLFTAEIAEATEMNEGQRISRITETIIGAGINVHGALGPGLLESADEACLAYSTFSAVRYYD